MWKLESEPSASTKAERIEMRFDLIDLRLFLHIAEARSITHGAARANLALASASARIRGMEEALGTALLQRGRRGVSLTPAGQCLLDHARLIVRQVEKMRSELGDYARGLRGSVRLLSNSAALNEHLPKALSSFLAANPNIDINLEERESAEIIEAVASGKADMGIASDRMLSDAVEKIPFLIDRLVLVVPAEDELRKRRRVFLREVMEREFVGFASGSALQRHLTAHAARLGASLKLRVRVGSFDAVCRMVEAGVGIGIIPYAAARRCRRSLQIGIVGLRDEWADRKLVICVRQLKDLPIAGQRLVEHLRATSANRR